MGTTPNFGIRYPDTSGPVTLSKYYRDLAEDADAAMTALDLRLDALESEATASLTYATSGSPSTPMAEDVDGGSLVERSGPWAVLNLNFRFLKATNSGVTFATIPVGYRPRVQKRFLASFGGASVPFGTIAPNGQISFTVNAVANQFVYGHPVTYLRAPS